MLAYYLDLDLDLDLALRAAAVPPVVATRSV